MINLVVEGESDREAAQAVVRHAGGEVARVIVAGGKTKLDPRIANYSRAARQSPWVVFRDSDGECPVELRSQLMAGVEVNSRFLLRIAHSMTEAWLMADREGFARYFGVKLGQMPADPESLPHAKRALVQVVGRGSRSSVRRDVVTAKGEVGPLYVTRINEFAADHWDVRAAAENSRSLARALSAVTGLR